VKYLVLVFGLVIGLGGLLFEQLGFRFNLTPSMPKGLYRISDAAPERGDLVTFCLDDPWFASLARERGYLRPGACPNELEPLLKAVVGTAGDHVYLTRGGVWLNGDLLPDSEIRFEDSLQRPLPPTALRSGRIPPDMALVMSNGHPGGFDGRYFGLVPMAALHKVEAVRVFTPKEMTCD